MIHHKSYLLLNVSITKIVEWISYSTRYQAYNEMYTNRKKTYIGY